MFESVISFLYLMCLRALRIICSREKGFIWDLNRSFNFIVIPNPLIPVKHLKYISKFSKVIENFKAKRDIQFAQLYYLLNVIISLVIFQQGFQVSEYQIL